MSPNDSFCSDCGWEIKEDPDPNFQKQPAQSIETPRATDPSNPYERDNSNLSPQSKPPPMGAGTHSDDDTELALGALVMFGMGRRIFRRRRRRAFFY